MILAQRRFQNVIVAETEICFTLENAMGAGGGNVPLILELHERKDFADCRGSGGAVIRWNTKESVPTLRASMNGHPPVVVLKEEHENSDNVRNGLQQMETDRCSEHVEK